MSKLQVFNHPTTTGTIKSVLVKSTRASFERPTTLPANWKRCRIAALFSLRGLANETATPVAETVVANGLLLNSYQIGLTNGAGMPGTTGVKFVGVSGRTDTNACVGLSYSWWSICAYRADAYHESVFNINISNGATVGIKTDGFMTGDMAMNTPLGQSGFCAGLVLELNVGINSALGVNFAMFSAQGPTTNDDVLLRLASMLTAGLTSGGTTHAGSGWWNNTDAPCDCTTLFFRLPYLYNRLVVHGYEVIQLD